MMKGLRYRIVIGDVYTFAANGVELDEVIWECRKRGLEPTALAITIERIEEEAQP